jgi:hypothetical protein
MKLSQTSGNEPNQKLLFCVSYVLVALEINKYIVEKCIYMLYIQEIYTLQVRMSNRDTGII